MVLDDVSIATMTAFNSWLYFKKLYDPKDATAIKPESDNFEERTGVNLWDGQVDPNVAFRRPDWSTAF